MTSESIENKKPMNQRDKYICFDKFSSVNIRHSFKKNVGPHLQQFSVCIIKGIQPTF